MNHALHGSKAHRVLIQTDNREVILLLFSVKFEDKIVVPS
ncbi:hypothetical protein MIZ01_2068 [Sideroxyarcus emersonii]|uniref:Uncharacterized protein n=1 Tax=Sideroxyarcus emersonii TaxID=2764705 RepID=A0AAN2BZN8_9PROT|nr:hypothetical protein MIZ01_2068 [Sideroxyarcus emersonii]